jgi:uncharacterized protein YndB with AHSA1/START domain
MKTDISTSTSVVIDAPADEVWRALTTPELIKQWFFGVDTESDWKQGSPIVHTGEWQGKPYVDKGEIVRIEPPHVLVHTHWSDLSGTPDSPEHYQEVTWEVSERNGGSVLKITEHNLPSDEAKGASDQAWSMVLRNLKTLLEGDRR